MGTEISVLPGIAMAAPVKDYDITDMAIWRTGGSLAIAESEALAVDIRTQFNPQIRDFQLLLATAMDRDALPRASDHLANLVQYVDRLSRVIHNIARQAPVSEWVQTLGELQRLSGSGPVSRN